MKFILYTLTVFLLLSCGGSGGSNNNSNQSGVIENFTGTWAMSDVVQNWGSDVSANCTAEDLQVNHQSTLLTVAAHSYKCSTVTIKENSFNLTINGSTLVLAGTNVGTIGPNYIHVNYSNGPENAKTVLILSVDPIEGGYSYRYEVTGYYQGAVYKNKVTAKLTRKS